MARIRATQSEKRRTLSVTCFPASKLLHKKEPRLSNIGRNFTRGQGLLPNKRASPILLRLSEALSAEDPTLVDLQAPHTVAVIHIQPQKLAGLGRKVMEVQALEKVSLASTNRRQMLKIKGVFKAWDPM